MSYAANSMFFGKINDTNPTELNRTIDYTKTKLEDRKEVVDEILGSGFYEEYFDEHFKVALNSSDSLSEHDNACNSLEKLANYLLNSEEVKEDKKSDEFEYKFYADEEAFRKAVEKEPKIDGMGTEKDNIIHYLKKENRNFKKSKNQSINKKDLDRDDELGQILRDYTDYLEKVTNELNHHEESKLSRFKLSEISGSLKQDMINTKDMLLGTFGYKTNAEESTVIDWDKVDFTNHVHVKALLYMKPGKRADEDLKLTIDEFVELIKLAKPTKLQREIILQMRDNKGPTEIGIELCITKQRVNKNIDMLVKRICKVAKQG
jgi:hypothetical protein